MVSFAINAGNFPVQFSDNVNNYISNLSTNATLAQRSGLINSSSSLNDVTIKNAPSSLLLFDGASIQDTINRNRPELFEYEVQYLSPGSDFIGLFNSFVISANLLTHYYDSLNNMLVFIPNIDTILNVNAHYKINSAISNDSLESIAKGKVKMFLSPFVGRIEFNRTDITRQNGSNILGVDVWFRRIFRDGMVLGNTSAIIVS